MMGGGASQAEAAASPRVLGSQSAWSEGPHQGRRDGGQGQGRPESKVGQGGHEAVGRTGIQL